MKSIDFDKGILIGKSGKKYYIQAEYLSAVRYEKYCHYIPQIAFGLNFKELWDFAKEIYLIATGKHPDIEPNNYFKAMYEIATMAYNLMQKIKHFGSHERRAAVLWFCMLFINSEDENLGDWDETKMGEKIDDLEEYNVLDFFLLAKNCILGLNNALRELEEIATQAMDKVTNGFG
jgi:hypothetical protein